CVANTVESALTLSLAARRLPWFVLGDLTLMSLLLAPITVIGAAGSGCEYQRCRCQDKAIQSFSVGCVLFPFEHNRKLRGSTRDPTMVI
ncbi:hypothetical protein BT96DRAFT_925083, partial [Gymnopus androsaceus JB14]